MKRVPVIGAYGMEEAPDNLVDQLGGLGLRARKLQRLTLRELRGVDLLHVLYPPMAWRGFIRARLLGVRTIAHWIGSDVERCHQEGRQRIQLGMSLPFIDCHLAVYRPLVDELAECLRLNAHYQPNLSIHLKPQSLPWPAERSVLCYVPPGDAELYGVPKLRRLARRLPGVRFLICGDAQPPADPPPNWEHLGFVDDVESLYSRVRVLVRPTRHDGLARMVLEALGYERRVVWSQRLPHVLTARDDDELADAVERALEAGPNRNGRRMIERHFDRRRHALRLLNLYSLLLERDQAEFFDD